MVCIRDRHLGNLSRHNLGQLINQQRTLVAQLVCVAALNLNDVDLLVQYRYLLRDRVDILDRGFDLIVRPFLDISQSLRHAVEVGCQILCASDKLLTGVDIRCIILQCIQ